MQKPPWRPLIWNYQKGRWERPETTDTPSTWEAWTVLAFVLMMLIIGLMALLSRAPKP